MNKASTSASTFNKKHRNFSETYKIVNEYIGEIYLLPKKLVDESEPAVDRYIRDCILPGAPRKNMIALPGLISFIDELDEFTADTYRLYDQHKKHFEKSCSYLKKIAMLKDKKTGAPPTQLKTTYSQLNRELSKLNQGLLTIKERADQMVFKLEKLELNWGKVRNKIKE